MEYDLCGGGPFLEMDHAYVTSSLNHRGHPGHAAYFNYLDQGKWVHLAICWKYQSNWSGPGNVSAGHWRIYVNGKYGRSGFKYIVNPNMVTTMVTNWTWHKYYYQGRYLGNIIRFGELSNCYALGSIGNYRFVRNYNPDGTIDELYVWIYGESVTSYYTHPSWVHNNIVTLWRWGRYYRPDPSDMNDGVFLSDIIDLAKYAQARALPEYIATPPPYESPATQPSGTTTATAAKIRIFGVSWTWWAEDYRLDYNGLKIIPIMRDYYANTNYDNPSPSQIDRYQIDSGGNIKLCCMVKLQIVDGAGGEIKSSNWYGDNDADGFSTVTTSNGDPLELEIGTATTAGGQFLRYIVKFRILNISPNYAVLLYSPIFDSITIFYDKGSAEFLLYTMY
jgi:hypothetical protein